MNIFKWLKNKAGKMPITLAQAAGITAVVGAAGFGAMSFLSSSSDTNNAFLPPSGSQGQVVYVSQSGGGGQYEANGEVGSSFKAAPSRAIQLANQQAQRQEQARALEEASQQTPSFGGGATSSSQTPQAYQLTGADLGQGLGGGKNKDLNATLDTFSTIQNQLSGVAQAMNNAQAQAGAAGQAPAAPGAPVGAAEGQTAAQLASASRNWGNGGLTHAGGGTGSANSFAIQNSGKNKRGGGQAAGEAMQQAGDAIAQAQASMARLQEGSRIRSQARFGSSEGFREDKDARTSASQRFANAKADLEYIRKHSARIASNKTNDATAGLDPFLASNRISGGLTVDGEQVTTGQTSTSSDFDNKYNNAMKGIAAKMASVQENMDERAAVRAELRSWIWKLLTVGLIAAVAVGLLVHIARSLGPFGWWAWAAAGVVSAAALFCIWYNTANKINAYTKLNDSDGWVIAGWVLSGVMTAGIGLAWFWGVSKLSTKLKNSFNYMLEKWTGKTFKAVIKTGPGIF